MNNKMQAIISKLGEVPLIRALVLAIMKDEDCVNTLFDINFLDKYCLTMAISKSINLVLFIGALLYKLPTIINIIKAKRADGIHDSSLYLETSSYIADAVYKHRSNFTLDLYADTLANIASNAVILSLFWRYNGLVFTLARVVLITGLLFSPYTFLNLVPTENMNLILSFSIIVIVTSRLLQIWGNFASKDTGVQSRISTGLAAAGTVAKAFTNATQTSDELLIKGGQLIALFNLILFLQVCYYQKSTKQKSE